MDRLNYIERLKDFRVAYRRYNSLNFISSKSTFKL